MRSLLPVSLFFFVLATSPCSRLAADPFPQVDTKLVANKEVTIRGVINLIAVPVPDAFETVPIQSGYFLITPNPLDAEGEDELQEGKMISAKGQVMFHLVIPDELAETIGKLAKNPVEIVALPFPAHTRHHRTPFLLQVKSIKALAK